MADAYCERMWLNPDGHPSTGSVVVYDGPDSWGDGNTTFLEIGSCHEVIRIHQTTVDTTADMIAKMERLHGAVGRFIEHLRRKESDQAEGRDGAA